MVGQSTFDTFSPGSEASAAINWTPLAAGTYTVYTQIDPENTVTESFEDNNLFHRTVEVLPSLPDQAAPHVDSFTINGNEQSTSTQVVRLTTTATDLGTPASGIHRLLYIEYEYSSSAQQWVRVHSSGWLDFATAGTNYTWTLTPSSGMKLLQAWVSDRAGNVSLFPVTKSINFAPDTHSIGLNQRKVFRYTLASGQTLSARLEAITGDPDLYIWSPEEGQAPWVSNLTTGIDDYDITASVAGSYQVEVYGYSAAEYRLIVTVSDTRNNVAAASVTSGVDPNKVIPVAPPVSSNVRPSNQVSIASPGVSQNRVLLPLIHK